MFKKIKSIFKKTKLTLDSIPQWRTDKCYQCGKILNKDIGDGYWSIFFVLGEKQYTAPICNECDKKNSLEGIGEKVNL